MEVENELRELDKQCSVLYRDRDYEKCIEILRRSLTLRMKVLGDKHKDFLVNLNNLGAALGRCGYLQEAEQAFREVIAKRESSLGKEHLDTATSMMHLGVCLKNQGKFQESEQHLYRSLKISLESANGGIEHLATAEASFAFACLSIQMGRICKAVFLFKLAERGLVKALGEEHQHTRDTIWWTKRSFELMTGYGKIPVLKEIADLMGEMASADGTTNQFKVPSHAYMNIWDGAEFEGKAFWNREKKCDVCAFEYTVTTREHHCRVCIRSVCDACSSSSRVFMGAVKTSKERCCNVCANAGFCC